MPFTEDGDFVRGESMFRSWIKADGSTGFKAEPNRYHLYVCQACPWAQRTLISRKIKGLEDVISVTFLHWVNVDGFSGWGFTDKKPKCTLDTVNNCQYLKEVYLLAKPDYSEISTVPVLWDKQTKTIVNNESSEIIRMLNSEFNAFCKTDAQRAINMYPDHLRAKIDEANSWIYGNINDGTYKCGFARTQKAYDRAVKNLFDHLDKAEDILSKQRYLTGMELTEADIRLFTTLARFDVAYNTLFKCNRKRIIDYPNLWGFARDVYQTLDIGDTMDIEYIRDTYFEAHVHVNPLGIVAIGPTLDFMKPHGRDKL